MFLVNWHLVVCWVGIDGVLEMEISPHNPMVALIAHSNCTYNMETFAVLLWLEVKREDKSEDNYSL